MKKALSLIAAACLVTACASNQGKAEKLTVSLADPAWDGTTLPQGQQCKKNGGNGSTPTLKLVNVPEGTVEFHVEYNDMAWEGGKKGFHGIIGHTHTGGSEATLISVPGDILTGYPEGTRLVKDNGGFGAWKSHDGYMPPCSVKNQTHSYQAKVIAVNAKGKKITDASVQIARY